MGADVIRFPGKRRHARTSSTVKKSGLIFSRGMPVSFSIWKTRTKGTPRSTQRVTVDLSTEHFRAKSECLSPFSASNSVSGFVMVEDSCTTNNVCQTDKLRKPLTTDGVGIGILGAMPKSQKRGNPAKIYGGRQPRRPHYLAILMERYGVTRPELIEAIGVDKSLISRWLDEDKPSTPSPEWADKLGEFFGKGHDPVDIFADPNVDWIARLLRGHSQRDIDRAKAILEAALPAVKKAG